MDVRMDSFEVVKMDYFEVVLMVLKTDDKKVVRLGNSMALKKVVQMELHSVVDWDYVSVESLA